MVIKKIIYIAIIALSACGTTNNVELNESLPQIRTTAFSKALKEMGNMFKIYGATDIRILVHKASDKTGASVPSKAEIPNDFSDVMESTLNTIGSSVTYIPNDSSLMSNLLHMKQTSINSATVPEIIIDGGISEFDRSLTTKGDGLNSGAAIKESPFGFQFNDDRKSSISRISVDFNLMHTKTFSGIPHMTASNSINVHKALGEDSLSATIYGVSLGAKGTIKKIQGRHEAVRMLVQLSAIQLLGKYKKLPYWRLLPSTEPDPVVKNALEDQFYSLNPKKQVLKIQEYLYMNGHKVRMTGQLDSETTQALKSFQKQHSLAESLSGNSQTFIELYYRVPLTSQSKGLRVEVDRLLKNKTPQVIAAPEMIKPLNISRDVSQKTLGSITLSTNKSAYKIGDPLYVSFQVNKPMFVTIVLINSKNEMMTLFPNNFQNNYTKVGETYTIPPVNSDVTLKVIGPAGIDKIRAFASNKQISSSNLRVLNGEIDEDYLHKLLSTSNNKFVKSALNIRISQ